MLPVDGVRVAFHRCCWCCCSIRRRWRQEVRLWCVEGRMSSSDHGWVRDIQSSCVEGLTSAVCREWHGAIRHHDAIKLHPSTNTNRNETVLRERKSKPAPKFQPKVIRHSSGGLMIHYVLSARRRRKQVSIFFVNTAPQLIYAGCISVFLFWDLAT